MNTQIQTSFNGHVIPVIQFDGDTWFTSEHIGLCLGYAHPLERILEIFRRHKEELIPYAVQRKMRSTDGKQYDTRVFNEKGVMLITMFSKQPKAAEFRKWAIDVLTKYRAGQLQPVQQPLELKPTPTATKVTAVAPPVPVPAPTPTTIAVEQAEYIDLLKLKIQVLEDRSRFDPKAKLRVCRRWTDADLATLFRMHARGDSYPTIGKVLRRTSQSIKAQIEFQNRKNNEGDRS